MQINQHRPLVGLVFFVSGGQIQKIIALKMIDGTCVRKTQKLLPAFRLPA